MQSAFLRGALSMRLGSCFTPHLLANGSLRFYFSISGKRDGESRCISARRGCPPWGLPVGLAPHLHVPMVETRGTGLQSWASFCSQQQGDIPEGGGQGKMLLQQQF